MGPERTNRHVNKIHHQQDDWDEVHNQLLSIQKKSLEVSDPNDADEKEADEVARKVVNGGTVRISGTGSTINRKGEGAFETMPEFQSQLQSSKGGGQSLDTSTRNKMESKMGADFSGVKIHTGNNAHSMNEGVNAKAFAHGNDIYFKQGEYDPRSNAGKELLAHELTHTVQQKNGERRINRSALAEKKPEQKEILVSACLNFYGPGATTEFAQSATDTIQQFWNAAMGVVKIKKGFRKIKYKVKFEFTYEVYPQDKYTNAQMQQIAIGKASDPRQNFIETYKVRPPGKVSSMTGNKAIFFSEGSDKTEFAHEFGHGLGLDHPKEVGTVTVIDDSTGKEYKAYDFRGLDTIMTPDSNEDQGGFHIVDEKYRKDSKSKFTPDPVKPGTLHVESMDANMDEDKRQVTESDIDALNLSVLLKDKMTANLGGVTSHNWWGGELNERNDVAVDLQTELPSIDKKNYMPGMRKYEEAVNIQALKETGKKDAQFIQVIQIDFRFDPETDPPTRYFDNPKKGERINNADKPEMKDLYTENTIRYMYVDRSNYVPPYHPETAVDGIPPPNTKCLPGQPGPEKL